MLYPALLESGYDYNSAYAYYEKGIEAYENSMISSPWWERAKKLMKEAKPVKINGIDEEQILDWIDYNIDKYGKRREEKQVLIREEFVDKVTLEVEKICKEVEII